MKQAVTTLLTQPARAAVEDLLGLVALFAVVFPVLSLPGTL